MSFVVRKATPDDMAAVSDLLDASYSTLLAADYDADLLRALLPVMGRANPALLTSGRYFVVEGAGGSLLASGGWSTKAPGQKNVVNGEAHIRHFGTHPAATRLGAGSRILSRCIEEARNHNIHALHCYSTRTAVPFYSSLGFKPLEDIEVPMGEALSIPSVLMRLDLC